MQKQSLVVNLMVGACIGFGLCMIMQSIVYPDFEVGCKMPVVKQQVVPVEVILPVDEFVDAGVKSEQEQLVVPVVEVP